MKTGLYFTLTLITFITLAFVPNAFAQEVKVIYFIPNDRTAQPDIDSKLDLLLKETQTFFADVMESNGFGRKTFSLETDTDENLTVHHFTGQFNDTHYHNGTTGKVKTEISQSFDLSDMIYYIAVDISSERLESPNGTICGTASGNAALTPASGQCFNYRVIAHELGHTFGLSHDRYNYSNIDSMVDSFCAAEWLDVHPAFNSESQNASDNPTTIEMSPPRLAPSSDAIRFSFTLNDTDTLHQAQLYIPDYDSVIACKNLNGSSNTTVEFTTTYIQTEINHVTLKTIDVNGNFIGQSFSVDISDFLKPGEVFTIPDANLAAAVRAYLDLDPSATLTTNTMKRLTRLWPISLDPITNLTGIEHATNLVALDLSKQTMIKDLSSLAKLKNLKFLNLASTGISDVSVLKELTYLERLDLYNNQISDITPLAGLTNLTYLGLPVNQISDITSLAGLTNLKDIDLWSNQISDITPLAALTNLTSLRLSHNQIRDVTPLENLVNLRELYLEGNSIENRKPLLALLRKNPAVKIYLKRGGEPLPVTLSSFRAEHTNTGVVLNWVTESEVDNAGFYIYRSKTNDGEFKVVNATIIQGAGTTGERNAYTWTDTTAKPNTVYYYRIEDVSHAGVREQLATVRLRGLVSARGKLTTSWADLKAQ